MRKLKDRSIPVNERKLLKERLEAAYSKKQNKAAKVRQKKAILLHFLDNSLLGK